MVGFDDAAIVGLIMALVQLAKETGLPARFAPLLALVLGVGAGVFFVAPGDYAQGVLSGVVLGLSAVGLYSGPKNVFKKAGNSYTVTVNVDKEKLEEVAKELIRQEIIKGDGEQ